MFPTFRQPPIIEMFLPVVYCDTTQAQRLLPMVHERWFMKYALEEAARAALSPEMIPLDTLRGQPALRSLVRLPCSLSSDSRS